MKLNTLINQFFEEKRYHIKARTLLNYQQCFKTHIEKEIGSCDIENLTQEDLIKYIVEKQEKAKLSKSYLNIIKVIINSALEYGYKRNLITNKLIIEMSFKGSNLLKIDKLSDKEILYLENYILNHKKYYHYGILISLYTGLRIGELLSLRWQNVDFQNKTLRVISTACDISYDNQFYCFEDTPKSESSIREIPLTKEIVTILKELKKFQKNKSEYVVSRENGKRLLIRSYQDSFSRLLQRLGLKHYGFHALRHTFASRCYRYGMDVKTLSEILGHSSPAITLKIYVHTDLDAKRYAMEMITKKIKRIIA